MPNVDPIAADFARAVERVQQGVVNAVAGMLEKGMTKEEVLLALQATNMETFILDTLGLQTDIDNLVVNYQTTILANMEMFGRITEEMLQSLVAIDRATFMSEAGNMANLIRQELGRGILAGATEAEMRNAILGGANGVLRRDQAQTLANTALNTFSRTVTAEMADSAPKDQRYIYEGVIDERTRDICLAMASAGELTKDEIDSQFPGSLSDGGGYNCRHQWTPTAAAVFTDVKGAGERISARGDKWKTPLTPLQQAQANA